MGLVMIDCPKEVVLRLPPVLRESGIESGLDGTIEPADAQVVVCARGSAVIEPHVAESETGADWNLLFAFDREGKGKDCRALMGDVISILASNGARNVGWDVRGTR